MNCDTKDADEVVEGCYCGSLKKSECSETFTCDACKKVFHPGCIEKAPPTSLEGDYFFNFKCKQCSENGEEEFSRMEMSWKDAVKLSLYNLQRASRGRCGYIKYNDICSYVGRNWVALFGPNRKKKPNLCGTIAGTLSSNKDDFVNGSKEFQAQGYWRLRENRPPVVCRSKQRRQPKNRQSADASLVSKEEHVEPVRVEGLRARRAQSSLQSAVELKARRTTLLEAKEIRRRRRVPAMELDTVEAAEQPAKVMKLERPDTSIPGSSHTSPASFFSGNDDSLHSVVSDSLSFHPDAEVPEYLFENEEEEEDQESDLDIDASALPGAGSYSPELSVENMVAAMDDDKELDLSGNRVVTSEWVEGAMSSDSDVDNGQTEGGWGETGSTSRNPSIFSPSGGMTGAKTLPRMMESDPRLHTQSTQVSQGSWESNSEDLDEMAPRFVLAGQDSGDGNRGDDEGEDVSEEEEECDDESSQLSSGIREATENRTKEPSQPSMQVSSRKRNEPKIRKLSEYEEKQLLAVLEKKAEKEQLTVRESRLRCMLKVRKEKRSRGLEIFQMDKVIARLSGDSSSPEPGDEVTTRQTAQDPNQFNTPQNMTDLEEKQRLLDKFRVKDVSAQYYQGHTFLQMLIGRSDLELRPITSPYTNRILKPFIFRDSELSTPKMKLLQEIQAYHHRDDPTWSPPAWPPIDFCYVRPEHIPAVNSLAREFFWPGIDMSDGLLWPDYTCVVLFRKLVIAFAFMIPGKKSTEAYITFMFTHPEWRQSNIGTIMMYHLIQTAGGKDITLHVSVNNPAMTLYQKFGFKSEELIYNFYDKYLPWESPLSRHAFYMRFHRTI